MTNLLNWLTRGSKNLTIHKSPSGDWTVKRGLKVLYVGTREQCEAYIASADHS